MQEPFHFFFLKRWIVKLDGLTNGLELLFPEKARHLSFILILSLFSTKKSAKDVHSSLLDEKLLLHYDVKNRRNDFFIFQRYYMTVNYLFRSLAKSYTIF